MCHGADTFYSRPHLTPSGQGGQAGPPPTHWSQGQSASSCAPRQQQACGGTHPGGGLGPPAANSSTLCAPCSLGLSCLPTCPQLLQFFLCSRQAQSPRVSLGSAAHVMTPEASARVMVAGTPPAPPRLEHTHPAGTPWVSTSSWQRGHFIHHQESRLALWIRLYTMASAVVCPDGFSLLGRPPQDATFPPPIPRAILVSWPSSLARVERPFPGASQQDAEGHSTTSPCCSGRLCPFWWPSAALSDFVGLLSVLSSPWGPRML